MFDQLSPSHARLGIHAANAATVATVLIYLYYGLAPIYLALKLERYRIGSPTAEERLDPKHYAPEAEHWLAWGRRLERHERWALPISALTMFVLACMYK